MAQRPKEHIRAAILDAALREFAQVGFARATLARIASQAGTSIGNLYKYFPNKDALFAATVPAELVAELARLFRERVRAFGAGRSAYREASEALLTFSLAHRDRLLFLLHQAAQTPHARFREGLERELVRLAIAYARKAHPAFQPTRARRRTLGRIYRAFVASLATILEEESSEAGVRAATGQLVTYHLAGLRAFFGERTS